MQRFIFGLILASLFSMATATAMSADVSHWSHENAYGSQDEMGCSCDAPGVVGTVCATRYRCREMDGLCLGSCASVAEDESGCSCDAPGVVGQVCATPHRCREMDGLCLGRC